jgi:hypothetical protein
MGIINEMIDEAVDGAMENNELEEETDEEVNKVLDEVLAGKKIRESFVVLYYDILGKVRNLPTVVPGNATAIATDNVDSEDAEFEKRLQVLKS